MISAAGLPSTSYVERRGRKRRIRSSSSIRVICSSTTSPAKEDITRVTRSKSVAATKTSADSACSTSYVDRRRKRIRTSSSSSSICVIYSSTTLPAKEDTARVTRSKSVAATKPTTAAYATRSRTIKPAVAANPPTTTSSSSSSSTRVIATKSKTRAKEDPTKRRSQTVAYATRSRTTKPAVAANLPPTATPKVERRGRKRKIRTSSSSSSIRVICSSTTLPAKENTTCVTESKGVAATQPTTAAYATRSRTIKPPVAANPPTTTTPKVERRGRKRKICTSSSSIRVICSTTTSPAKEDTTLVTRSKSIAANKPTTAAYATRSRTVKPPVAANPPPTKTSSSSSSSTRVIATDSKTRAKEDPSKKSRTVAYATRSRTTKPPVAANPPPTTTPKVGRRGRKRKRSSSTIHVICSSATLRAKEDTTRVTESKSIATTNSKTRAKEDPTKRRSRTTAFATRSRTTKPPVTANLSQPEDDESDVRGDTDFCPLDETETDANDITFNPSPVKKQKPERRSRTAPVKSRRKKNDPEQELSNRMLQRMLAGNDDPDYLLREIRTAEEERNRVAAAAENEDFFGGAPTFDELLRNHEDVYYADVILGIHDDVEPEIVQPPQNQTRGRKRNATAAPKLKKANKLLKKAVGPEIPTQRLTTRSMAAAAAQDTTIFASLENPPLADLIFPTSSTVAQQPSSTDTNFLLQSSVLDFSAVPQTSMLNSATAPRQISTADIHSSTVPQPSMDDDVFYEVDDLFYATPLSSTTAYNSASVPSQPSMNNDDNLLHQSMLETPAENFVDQEFYQNDEQMEFIAGQYYIRFDGVYVYFDGENMIPVDPSQIYDENGMPVVAVDSSGPEAVVDPSSLPASSSTSVIRDEVSYPLAHSDTPSEEEMNPFEVFAKPAHHYREKFQQNDSMLMASSSSEGYGTSDIDNLSVLSNYENANDADATHQRAKNRDEEYVFELNINLNDEPDTNDETAEDDGFDSAEETTDFFADLDASTRFKLAALDQTFG